MGDKIPLPVSVAPVPAGDLSIGCWGVGKPFGEGPTPSQLIMRVSGVVKSDLWQPSDGNPNNGEYLMEQSPINTFEFKDNTPGRMASITFFPFATIIDVWSDTFIREFGFSSGMICQLFVNNELENPFKGGSARVWIPKVQV